MAWRGWAFLALSVSVWGCWALRPSAGGGQTAFSGPRQVDPADVVVPSGYQVEAVASGLTFPTAVTFDGDGRPVVVESGYSYGEVWTTPKLVRVSGDGSLTTLYQGQNGPWTGAVYHGGDVIIAEGGHASGGRIVRVDARGRATPLVTGLPSLGDHHTNGPVLGPDGWLYFGQGTATNSAVVGEDNARFGWLKRHPEVHDVPCRDVVLSGVNHLSPDPLASDRRAAVSTGAFVPFGTSTGPGMVIRGSLPCSGAVMRVRPTGGPLELVAWGFRNPYALAFDPAGRLYAAENGYDERGSRPVCGAGDHLWQILPGHWYGWPDYAGGAPLTADGWSGPGREPLPFLMARHPNLPPKPAASLGVHAAATGFDFARRPDFGFTGQAFMTQFGDMAPAVGNVMAPVGFKVVRVDVGTGTVTDFAANRGPANGPASRIGSRGFERPIDARFSPDGRTLYVVDFGVMTMGPKGPQPRPQTGVLWRISRATPGAWR